MPPRWLVLLGSGFEYLPLLAGLVAWRRLAGGRRWVVAWGLYAVLGTLAQRRAAHEGSNLWLTYILVPLDASLAIWALSCFAHRPLLRNTLRWIIPVALVIHVAALVLLENRNGFSIIGVPSYALIAFAAALATFVSRALDETGSLFRQDWFWIAGAYALYFSALGVLTPLAAALIKADPALVIRALLVFLGLNMAVNAAVAVGLLCPVAEVSRAAR